MGIVVSLLMIAVGAIMRYAVTVEGNGFDMDTVGMILMIIGAIGAVISIAFWTSWGGFGHRGTGTTTQSTVVREREVH
jgi:hypothetical protein